MQQHSENSAHSCDAEWRTSSAEAAAGMTSAMRGFIIQLVPLLSQRLEGGGPNHRPTGRAEAL